MPPRRQVPRRQAPQVPPEVINISDSDSEPGGPLVHTAVAQAHAAVAATVAAAAVADIDVGSSDSGQNADGHDHLLPPVIPFQNTNARRAISAPPHFSGLAAAAAVAAPAQVAVAAPPAQAPVPVVAPPAVAAAAQVAIAAPPAQAPVPVIAPPAVAAAAQVAIAALPAQAPVPVVAPPAAAAPAQVAIAAPPAQAPVPVIAPPAVAAAAQVAIAAPPAQAPVPVVAPPAAAAPAQVAVAVPPAQAPVPVVAPPAVAAAAPIRVIDSPPAPYDFAGAGDDPLSSIWDHFKTNPALSAANKLSHFLHQFIRTVDISDSAKFPTIEAIFGSKTYCNLFTRKALGPDAYACFLAAQFFLTFHISHMPDTVAAGQAQSKHWVRARIIAIAEDHNIPLDAARSDLRLNIVVDRQSVCKGIICAVGRSTTNSSARTSRHTRLAMASVADSQAISWSPEGHDRTCTGDCVKPELVNTFWPVTKGSGLAMS